MKFLHDYVLYPVIFAVCLYGLMVWLVIEKTSFYVAVLWRSLRGEP